jgi:hypothetical protein
MSEVIYYIDHNGNYHELSTSPYKYLKGEGLTEWFASPLVDWLPYNIGVYRSHQWEGRVVELDIAVQGGNYYTVAKNVQELYAMFLADVDEQKTGTLRICTDNDDIYDLTVAAQKPETSQMTAHYARVKLRFISPDHHFSWLPGGTATGTFSGSTAVAMTFYNPGDVETWPTFVITGLVKNPKFTYPSASFIMIAASTAAAADILTIYTKPGDLAVTYQAGGSAASCTNWTGYGGSVSTWGKLPVGASDITLSASTGTATVSMTWNNLKAAIA